MILFDKYINNETDVCVWETIFDSDERIILQRGLLLTGLLSVVFSGWLNVTLLFTSFWYDISYRNMANFTCVASIRRILLTLLRIPLVKVSETFFDIEILSCNIFAFLETFLAVLEVECLTHVCIERYVLAKYITNGWQIKKKHYDLYLYLCLFFACVYSVPPLFGIGRYYYDFDCASCTFDVLLPRTWQLYVIVPIFILRSIKPAVVMTMMLMWARVLEKKFPCSMKQHKEFTQNIIVVAFVNILCWSPIVVIKGCLILSQLAYFDMIPMLSGFYVVWAMWIHWIAPAITALALFAVDNHLRYKMLNLCEPTYAMKSQNKTE